MVKVAIIDDHAVVRMGLKYMLDVHKRDLAFAGDWPKGEGAAEFVAKVEPDVVLLDIRMPDRDANEIPVAIDRVMNGGKYVPEAVMELFRKRQMTPDLTPREVEVMEYLRAGLTNETIAQRMGITRDTVKLHLKNIFVKFDVGDRISALREAVTRGFLR